MTRAWRVVQRNAIVYRRVWRGSVFFSFLQPVMYLVAMGIGVGSLVDPASRALPPGLPFLHFIGPGLLAAVAMQTAMFESSYPILNRMTWQRNYEAITATPVGIFDLVVGELAWIAIRLSTVVLAFMVVLTAFHVPRSPWAILAAPAALLTGLAFSAPILAYAATLKTSGTFNVVVRFGLTPLFLFSGVFFPLAQVPASIRAVAWATPLFHGVELTRGLMLGTLQVRAAAAHVAYLAVMCVLGIAAATRTFQRRLHR